MAILGFRPEFRDKVEDGRKCRTYRMAKCVHEKTCGLFHYWEVDVTLSPPDCYLNCPGYEYRIKTGDTIHAYTGLRQRLYCKVNWCMDGQQGNDGRCNLNAVCSFQGAKLLRKDPLPKCIDTYPIKLQNITEEDARLDGFDPIVIKYDRPMDYGDIPFILPLTQLKEFFINTYNAKPDTPIQAIIWEELKGHKGS